MAEPVNARSDVNTHSGVSNSGVSNNVQASSRVKDIEYEVNKFLVTGSSRYVRRFIVDMVRAQCKSVGAKQRPTIKNMTRNYKAVFCSVVSPANKFQHQYAVFIFVMMLLSDSTASKVIIAQCPHHQDFFPYVRKLAMMVLETNFSSANAVHIVEQVHRSAIMMWLTHCRTHNLDAVPDKRYPGHPGV